MTHMHWVARQNKLELPWIVRLSIALVDVSRSWSILEECVFICSRIKKGDTHHVSLRQNTEEKGRGKGAKTGVGRLERMTLHGQETTRHNHRDCPRCVCVFYRFHVLINKRGLIFLSGHRPTHGKNGWTPQFFLTQTIVSRSCV